VLTNNQTIKQTDATKNIHLTSLCYAGGYKALRVFAWPIILLTKHIYWFSSERGYRRRRRRRRRQRWTPQFNH